MGEIATLGRSWLRDYITDGVPSSGANPPAKVDGRALFTLIDSSVEALELAQDAGLLVFDTVAHLNADLAHPAQTGALVIADPSGATVDGIYIKSGASGAGSWTRTDELPWSASAIDFNTLLTSIWPATFPNAVAVAENGTPSSPLTFSSTFSGWSVPFDWDGSAADFLLIYYNIETPAALMRYEIRRGDTHAVLCYGEFMAWSTSGLGVVRLDRELNTGLYAAGIIYITHQAVDGASRVGIFNVTGYDDVASPATYPQKYTTTVSPNTWSNVVSGSPAGTGENVAYRLYHSSTFNPAAVGGVPNPEPNELVMPERLFVMPGIDTRLYLNNIRAGHSPVVFSVTGSSVATAMGKVRGAPGEEYWWFPPVDISLIYTVPAQYAAARTLTLNCHDAETFAVLSTTSISLDNIDKTSAAGNNLTVLTIGDSTWAGGQFTAAMLAQAAASGWNNAVQLTLIGTQGTGSNKHEAHSGWDAGTLYANVGLSPMINPGTSKFEFDYYLSHNSLATPEVILWGYGINSEFGQATDVGAHTAATISISNMNNMIGFTVAAGVNSIRDTSTAIKHLIGIPMVPSWSEDGFGYAYNVHTDISRQRWRHHRNMIIYAKRFIDEFGGREAENVYLVPMHACIDMHYSMPYSTEVANPYTARTTIRETEGVHSSGGGYEQMMSVWYPWLNGLVVRAL